MRGELTSAKPGRNESWLIIEGWLADDERPGEKVSFELVANGEKVGNQVAAGEAPAADGTARRFHVPVEPRFMRPGANEFLVAVNGAPLPAVAPLVVILDERRRLAALPLEGLASVDGKRRLRGRIQRLSAGVLYGFLWDLDTNAPVRFDLLANDRHVGSYVADRKLPNPSQRPPDKAHFGFRVPLRREWIEPVTIFALRIQPGGHLLPDEFEVEAANMDWGVEPEPKLESTERAIPAELGPKDLVRQMKLWDTERIAAFFALYEGEVMLPLAKGLFKDKQWFELTKLLPTSVPFRPRRLELDVLVGRGLLYHGATKDAATILGKAARVAPEIEATQFYAAVASARAGRLEEAVTLGRHALRLNPSKKKYLIDHGVHCRRLASARKDSDLNMRRSLLNESIEVFARALAIDDNRVDFCLLQIARSELELDRFSDAAVTLERLLKIEPDHVDGLSLLSHALVALNRVKEALDVAERVVELDPLRQGPRFQLRSLQALADVADVRPFSFGLARWRDEPGRIQIHRLVVLPSGLATEQVASVDVGTDPALALSKLDIDWLILSTGPRADAISDEERVRRLMGRAPNWAGRIVSRRGPIPLAFWRRELLLNLVQSGSVESLQTLPDDVEALESLVATLDADEAEAEAEAGRANPTGRRPLADTLPRLGVGPVVAMSRHGIVKFGGGEHFIDSMAQHYSEMGFDPVIVGTRPDRAGEEGEMDGRRYAFVDMNPVELRRYFLRLRPRFVHVLSGLGYQVAEALEFLDIPFVYGVHYWRDCLGLAENDTRFFANHDREPIPRPAFRYLIEKAAAVYSNSEYTREVLEESFGIRTPVIYSLPREVEDLCPEDAEIDIILDGWRNYLLLVNAMSDKGFDLIVETAKRVPNASFLVIASQSDRDEAEASIAAAGVGNVRLIEHTSRMDVIYSRARAVAVASYRFVETFSRVCIEAQRYGKPVLGATVGNVPYLLRQSGVVLPDDPDVWADEVQRIWNDEPYYARLCEAARENSRRYGYKQQKLAVNGLVSTLPSSVLIGVGSGIGNMLHVGPMIRNIARRLGRKVDLVMTEDHSNGHFLLQDDQFVNTVFSLRQEVLRRRYDMIFITHSFGNARLPFQGGQVLYSRDWMDFKPEGPFHETVYNLEAAKVMLGVPYDEKDIRGHYIGNFRYQRPDGPLRIGLHGGSKDGFWMSKRWPGHSELAARLHARGVEIASVGVAEEYVPGTINLTGGSICEMVERMLGLHYLISNDSGLMNIANALGLPVMGLFGPTNPETRAPIGADSRWLAITKDCAPCEVTLKSQRFFQSGECRCIAELTVDRVEAAVLDHLTSLGLLGSDRRLMATS